VALAREQERQRSRQQADAHAEQLKIKDEAISALQSELAKAMSIDGLMERLIALQQLMQPEKNRGTEVHARVQNRRKSKKPRKRKIKVLGQRPNKRFKDKRYPKSLLAYYKRKAEIMRNWGSP